MTERSPGPLDIEAALAGGGETGALMRTTDWSQTPLGPVRDWPQSLRTALSISMSSRFPITLYWGSEFLMLYNDDLLPMVGANKHPWAWGRPAFEVLPEIRSIIEPLLRTVVDTGEAIWSEDLMLPMQRGDAPEEGYFTFTYSPVRDESGGVGGVFCAVLETTDKVIEGRRLRLLNALTEATRAKAPAEACAFAAAKIAEATSDVPFALLYLADEPAGVVRLAGIANIDPTDALAPSTIPLGDDSIWPFDLNAPESKERVIHLDDSSGGARGPGGARGAVILPIERAGGGRPLGFIVAGLSNLLRSSESYERFHHLLAASVAQIVSNAAAHEAERKRAEALAELDHAKTAFFSNVSHEFRTPLTLLLGPAEDALHDPATPPANRARLEIIHRNALRLQKLVTALLDFSRLEAGRMEASYVLTDAASLTADVASAFRSAIENAGLRFNVDTPPVDLPIYLDRGMWETILLNLLSNAFKFTVQGKIGVRLRQTDRGFELLVTDTGTGIPERELPHIFQRFHRVQGTEGRTHEGTGIGLALVQELVKLHGGTIGVSSREGEGTTFTVSIPSGSDHLPAERISASETTVSGAPVSTLYVDETIQWLRKERGTETASSEENAVDDGAPRPRIVLADDNSDMREYVRRLLASRYDVVACPDGRAALEEIRRHPPDLVLSDVMMPELDGFGLLAALRADAALCAVPVIMLSARAGEESKIEGMDAGADDYLIKPFSARELMARVGAQIAISTMRREAQRSVADSERRLRAIVDQTTAGIALADREGRFLFVNDRFCEIAGRSRAELLSLAMQDIVFAEDLQQYLPSQQSVVRDGRPFVVEQRYVHHDGSVVWVSSSVSRMEGEDDQSRGVLTVSIDISDRKRAEEQLLENERRFHFMLDAMPQKVFTAGSSGGVDYLNPQWAEFTGLAFEEIGNQGWALFLHPDDVASNGRGWERAVETGEAFTLEHRFRRADGEYRWHLSRALPVRNRDGEILMWIGASTDVHAFKEAEQVLRDADRMKDEFLATLSHELRTPLTSILGWSHLLLSASFPRAERVIGLEAIRNSAKTQSQLIEDVLDISRIVTGKMRLEREPADLAAIVDEAVSTIRPAAEAKRIPLTVTLDRTLGRHFLDPMRVQQIVWNLLTNAIKFSPNGAPIDVSLRRESSSAVVVISDQGPGIPADFLPLIFERFLQADGSARRGHTGLGLGLALVKELTELHGGTIHVESEVGRGTRFTVSLPLPALRQLDEGEKETGQTAGERPLTRVRVLYVDDVEDARLMVSTMLRQYGADVESAASATDALGMLDRVRPHVVLTDIAMPDRDGFDLLNAVQSNASWNALPVIALTAQSGIDDERRAKAAGFRSYLRKPVDVEHLVSVLAHVANRQDRD
jgi:PAS domain S-box-containing protein